jgi:hypothetical protein
MKGRSKVVVVPHKRQWPLNGQANNVVSILVHAYLACCLIHHKLRYGITDSLRY